MSLSQRLILCERNLFLCERIVEDSRKRCFCWCIVPILKTRYSEVSEEEVDDDDDDEILLLMV